MADSSFLPLQNTAKTQFMIESNALDARTFVFEVSIEMHIDTYCVFDLIKYNKFLVLPTASSEQRADTLLYNTNEMVVFIVFCLIYFCTK